MTKRILPIILLVLGGIVTAMSSLAIHDLRPRFGVNGDVTPLVDWENEYTHYMRIRRFMPTRWMVYTSLVEQVFLDSGDNMVDTNKGPLPSVRHVKAAMAAVHMNGEMKQHLEARRHQGIIIMILGAWWMSALTHRRKNAEPAPSPYSSSGADAPSAHP